MIKVCKVCKSFQKEPVVKQVDVEFKDGKITGIIGRNGSGKTVLFKMICGLMLPTSGEIIVNKERVGKDVDFPSVLELLLKRLSLFLIYQDILICLIWQISGRK